MSTRRRRNYKIDFDVATFERSYVKFCGIGCGDIAWQCAANDAASVRQRMERDALAAVDGRLASTSCSFEDLRSNSLLQCTLGVRLLVRLPAK
jgi:hypothetical protein